jgi:hypothetical protein
MDACGFLMVDRQGSISLHRTQHNLPTHVTQRFCLQHRKHAFTGIAKRLLVFTRQPVKED